MSRRAQHTAHAAGTTRGAPPPLAPWTPAPPPPTGFFPLPAPPAPPVQHQQQQQGGCGRRNNRRGGGRPKQQQPAPGGPPRQQPTPPWTYGTNPWTGMVHAYSPARHQAYPAAMPAPPVAGDYPAPQPPYGGLPYGGAFTSPPPSTWDPAHLAALHSAPSPSNYGGGGNWYMDTGVTAHMTYQPGRPYPYGSPPM